MDGEMPCDYVVEYACSDGGWQMKTVRVELNDRLAKELDALLQNGLFSTEEEAIRFALIRLIDSREAVIAEHFQHEDIAWALKQKRAAS